jgi:hypothetical protein
MARTVSPITIDISYRALLGRIDRALRKENQRLRADRRGGVIRYIVIDTKKRAVLETDVDLGKLARRLDVLQPWERAAM